MPSFSVAQLVFCFLYFFWLYERDVASNGSAIEVTVVENERPEALHCAADISCIGVIASFGATASS
jgi:hypothetical protein